MKYNLPKSYLSASSIGTFLKCPKQFEFRYVEGIISPPTAALLAGTAMHTGFEQYYKDILEGTSNRMTSKMVGELAQITLEENAKNQEVELEGEVKDEAMLHVALASESYINNVGKYVEPIAVEEEIRYTSKCGVDILGFIDLTRRPIECESTYFENFLMQSEEDQFPSVILNDYKLTNKKWNLNQLSNSLQFNLYAIGTDIRDIEICNLTKVKAAKKLPKKSQSENVVDIMSNFRLLRHHFDGRDFDHVENLIEKVARIIHEGLFMPCSMDSWCCNENWCGYWNLCRGQRQTEALVYDMAS